MGYFLDHTFNEIIKEIDSITRKDKHETILVIA